MELKEQIEALYRSAAEKEYDDPRQSYDIAKEGMKLAEQEQLTLETADGFYQMSCACRVMSDYSNGLEHALKALELYRKMGYNPGVVNAKMMIGIIYFYFGDYSSALSYFMEAESAITEDVPKRRVIAVANNIGEVYREAGDYEAALKAYNRGLTFAQSNHLEERTPILYNNISEVYMAQAEYDHALDACMRAYRGLTEEDAVNKAEVEYKLGKLKMYEGDYDAAEKHYYAALTRLNRMNNRFYMIELLINMSELAAVRGQNPLTYLKEALETAQSIQSDSKISRIYKLLSEHYEKQGDYKSALIHYKNYHMKEKEIEADNLSHRLALMLVEIDYSHDKHESERLKALSEKLKRDVKKSNHELEKIRRENTVLLKENCMDELTGSYNRRGLYQKLEEVLIPENEALSVIYLIDIDHFKHYNDTWGHIQGDICLKMVTHAMKGIEVDKYFVGRYGGEEFICYAQVKDLAMAEIIGEQIRRSVERLKINVDKEDSSRYLTVSVGGTVGPMKYERIQQWIDRADRQLYEAKWRGRNQVVIEEE